MDHDSVIDNKTPERYMLGELTDAEGDAYEEHYFECPECAEELRSGVEFMHCAREVMQQEAATQFLWLIVMARCLLCTSILSAVMPVGRFGRFVVLQSSWKAEVRPRGRHSARRPRV